MRKNGIIDLHCDTILLSSFRKKTDVDMSKNQFSADLAVLNNYNFRDGDSQITVEKLEKGNSMCQCMAIWLPTHDELAGLDTDVTDTWELYKIMYATYKKMMEANKDKISQVFCVKDIKDNWEKGKLSSLLTIEDSVLIEGKMERFDELYKAGVRMMSLTWNYENCIAFPNSKDPALHAKGLKPFGIDAIAKMNELGIIVDTAHLSEGGFYDVAKYSKKPFIASHSCCRALCGHSRNLTDDQLKVVGDTGSVVGINFFKNFLSDTADVATVDLLVQHALHIKDKAGVEALAFGSDYDGIGDAPVEWGDVDGIYNGLVPALEKVLTDDELEKMCNGNFLRVLAENEK